MESAAIRRDGIGGHFCEYESCGTCAVAFVRFEHGRFGTELFVEILEVFKRVDDSHVMLAELVYPLLVLRKLDSFFRLVGILLGYD